MNKGRLFLARMVSCRPYRQTIAIEAFNSQTGNSVDTFGPSERALEILGGLINVGVQAAAIEPALAIAPPSLRGIGIIDNLSIVGGTEEINGAYVSMLRGALSTQKGSY